MNVNTFHEGMTRDRLMHKKGSVAQVPPGFKLEMWESDESRMNNDPAYTVFGRMRPDRKGVEC